MRFYVLDESGLPVLHAQGRRDAQAFLGWAVWMEKAHESGRARIGRDQVGAFEVSTVFLGIDYGVRQEGEPLVFETMIFGPCGARIVGRCASIERAREMHAHALAEVQR